LGSTVRLGEAGGSLQARMVVDEGPARFSETQRQQDLQEVGARLPGQHELAVAEDLRHGLANRAPRSASSGEKETTAPNEWRTWSGSAAGMEGSTGVAADGPIDRPNRGSETSAGAWRQPEPGWDLSAMAPPDPANSPPQSSAAGLRCGRSGCSEYREARRLAER
jgi:hypothetical protein